MSPISKLTELFTRFPGIGPRQANRFVYYLLHHSNQTTEELIQAIRELKATTSQCSQCFRFFTDHRHQKSNLCNICVDETHDHTTLLIVEKDADLENVRKTDTYHGLYFVIGGLLSILEKNPEQKIRVRELKKRVEEMLKNKNLKEVVLGLSASVEGDNTAEYLHKILREFQQHYDFAVTTLGRGLSTGTELEYSDPDTIREALRGRHS
jgi:recombination protein RecR